MQARNSKPKRARRRNRRLPSSDRITGYRHFEFSQVMRSAHLMAKIETGKSLRSSLVVVARFGVQLRVCLLPCLSVWKDSALLSTVFCPLSFAHCLLSNGKNTASLQPCLSAPSLVSPKLPGTAPTPGAIVSCPLPPPSSLRLSLVVLGPSCFSVQT